MGWSIAVKNELNDHMMFSDAYTAPTSYFVGLSKAAPGDDGSGVDEPVIGTYNYARVETTPATDWAQSSSGITLNSNNITFNEVQTAAWGLCPYACLWSAASSGTFLGWGKFDYAQDAIISNYQETTASGTIDDTSNPILPYNEAEKTGVILVTFQTASVYEVSFDGDIVGQAGISADAFFCDPATGELLLKIPSAFWGGTWAAEETVQAILTSAVSGALNCLVGYIPRIKAGDFSISM